MLQVGTGQPSCVCLYATQHVLILLSLNNKLRYRLVCTGEPPPKVCPCGDLTGSGRDVSWFSGVQVPGLVGDRVLSIDTTYRRLGLALWSDTPL